MKIEEVIKTHKNLDNVTKALSGKKVKYQFNSVNSGGGIKPGSVIKILSCPNSLLAPYYGAFICETPIGQRTVYGCEMKFEDDTIESIEESIKDLKKSIDEQKEEVKVLESKIKFMEENKLDTYDENVFKAYHTLSIISEGTTTMEKAKAIAELFKG